MIQIIIPMAGLGTRFTSFGFKTNKYLLPINVEKQPMIELAITSLNVKTPCKYFFIINEENGHNESLRNLLSDICKKYNLIFEILSVSKLTEGPASTVNIVRDVINEEYPILVSNSDQILENWNFENFLKTSEKYYGCVLTYTPNYNLEIGKTDKHSFIHIGENGTVDECREKIILSDKALVGVHYFKTAKIFFDAYDYMVKNNIRAPNGEFYLSLCYQSMIETNKTVGYHDLNINEYFWPVGEPDDYFHYLYKNGGYSDYKERLQDESILFSNGISLIKYKRSSDFIVKNPGLIILIKGNAYTYNTKNIEKNKKIEKYEITNMDLILENECEYISIKCNEYQPKEKIDIYNSSDFIRHWIVGDFKPSIFKTKQFEIGLPTHKKGEKWDFHYHENIDEINVLLEGNITINNKPIHRGDIFYIQRNQLTCPNFLESSRFLCIKNTSIIGDKICL
jgi:UDP-N-acetylglucosamine diphosphorylase / glucose-1-phosphate thymidylyltransferase / UDP-N-acetylgalactosamine diphosphorylase / glucosamine-1-phosphate N-acetyltransferase / galactosamine-1-phosphate N-acetyltransferase